MIICHEYKFIFIKTRKTAGTSIETALSKFCGEYDVITSLSSEDEKARKDMGLRGMQNIHVPLLRYSGADIANLVNLQRKRFHNHSSAAEARRYVGRGKWSKYFVFCVERNPFDRAVSQYFWKNRKLVEKPDMQEFFRLLSTPSMSNWNVYSSKDGVLVDRILRYENLDQELSEVGNLLGINIDISSIHAKSHTRTDKRNYTEIIDYESRLVIEERCAKEIKHFGYQWNVD
jgi:hypothetical protein